MEPHANSVPTLLDLPTELLVAIGRFLDCRPEDVLTFCMMNPEMATACATPSINWRLTFPQIETVLPPALATNRILSLADVAWYLTAVGALRKKCALFALREVLYKEALVRDHYNGAHIPGNQTDFAGDIGMVSFGRTPLSTFEAWVQSQGPLVGFYDYASADKALNRRKRHGPSSARSGHQHRSSPIHRDSFTCLTVPPLTGGVDRLVEYARDGAFASDTRHRVNDRLTRALDQRDVESATWAQRIQCAEIGHRQVPAVRGTRPLNIHTALSPFCEDIDLWAAYPEAQAYIVGVAGTDRTHIATALPL